MRKEGLLIIVGIIIFLTVFLFINVVEAAYSNWVNSTELEILNTLPTVTLTGPEDNANVVNRTPEFNWTGYDADDDSLTYQINITLYAASLCTDTERNNDTLSTNSYVPSPFMNCLIDNGDYYNWTVRASDDGGSTWGAWATERRVNFQSYVLVTLINDTVSFGSVSQGGSANTTTNNPWPFWLQNDGNVFVNVSVNATDLWNIQANPSNYFRYKADNKTGQEGSFDWTESVTSWQNMPDETQEVVIASMNWSDATDSVEVDLLVTVPSGEGSGQRESSVVFEAELVE